MVNSGVVWRWCREELRLVLTTQHTNNTRTVEQWEISALSLIIDIQARPTACTPPRRPRRRSHKNGRSSSLCGRKVRNLVDNRVYLFLITLDYA